MSVADILIAAVIIVVIIIMCCACCSKETNPPLYQCECLCLGLRQKCVGNKLFVFIFVNSLF